MAKLTDFKTPTGATGNLFSLSSWTQLILGSGVLLVTFAIAQNLVGGFGKRVPFVDTTIEKPYVDKVNVVSNKVEII